MARYLYSELAKTQHKVNTLPEGEYRDKVEDYLAMLVNLLPSGSGVDSGTKVDTARTHNERVMLTFGFHHMNEHGYYDGRWTKHTAVVTPTFHGKFNLRITGRNSVKEHLYETFDHCLQQTCDVVFWRWVLGENCPQVKVRWVDQCRMVWDVHYPAFKGEPAHVQTYNPNTRTEQYTDWKSVMDAAIVQWCEVRYSSSGKPKQY